VELVHAAGQGEHISLHRLYLRTDERLRVQDTTDAIATFKAKKAPVFAPLSTPSKPVDSKEKAKL
jgi:hypothetical protein